MWLLHSLPFFFLLRIILELYILSLMTILSGFSSVGNPMIRSGDLNCFKTLITTKKEDKKKKKGKKLLFCYWYLEIVRNLCFCFHFFPFFFFLIIFWLSKCEWVMTEWKYIHITYTQFSNIYRKNRPHWYMVPFFLTYDVAVYLLGRRQWLQCWW